MREAVWRRSCCDVTLLPCARSSRPQQGSHAGAQGAQAHGWPTRHLPQVQMPNCSFSCGRRLSGKRCLTAGVRLRWGCQGLWAHAGRGDCAALGIQETRSRGSRPHQGGHAGAPGAHDCGRPACQRPQAQAPHGVCGAGCRPHAGRAEAGARSTTLPKTHAGMKLYCHQYFRALRMHSPRYSLVYTPHLRPVASA